MNKKLNNIFTNTLQRGFSLIEVLITLLILSIGLLGFAGLQVQSLQASNDSYLRDRATHLAGDIIHQIRANRTAALALQYSQPQANSLEVQAAACTLAGGCTSAVLAGDDLFNWGNAVRNNLTNGAGVVCIDSTPNDSVPAPSPTNPLCDGLIAPGGGLVYSIKIWWGNDNDSNNVPPLNDGNPDGIPDFFYVATHQP